MKGGSAIDPIINKPKNLADLKLLYQQFSPFLTDENKKMLLSLIEELEKDKKPSENENLKNIAINMQKQARNAEKILRKNGK